MALSPIQWQLSGTCCLFPAANRTLLLYSFREISLQKAPKVEPATLDKLFFLFLVACMCCLLCWQCLQQHHTLDSPHVKGGKGARRLRGQETEGGFQKWLRDWRAGLGDWQNGLVGRWGQTEVVVTPESEGRGQQRRWGRRRHPRACPRAGRQPEVQKAPGQRRGQHWPSSPARRPGLRDGGHSVAATFSGCSIPLSLLPRASPCPGRVAPVPERTTLRPCRCFCDSLSHQRTSAQATTEWLRKINENQRAGPGVGDAHAQAQLVKDEPLVMCTGLSVVTLLVKTPGLQSTVTSNLEKLVPHLRCYYESTNPQVCPTAPPAQHCPYAIFATGLSVSVHQPGGWGGGLSHKGGVASDFCPRWSKTIALFGQSGHQGWM